MTEKLFSHTKSKGLRNRVYVILAAALLFFATAPLVANTFGLGSGQYEAEASSPSFDDSQSDPPGGPYTPFAMGVTVGAP